MSTRGKGQGPNLPSPIIDGHAGGCTHTRFGLQQFRLSCLGRRPVTPAAADSEREGATNTHADEVAGDQASIAGGDPRGAAGSQKNEPRARAARQADRLLVCATDPRPRPSSTCSSGSGVRALALALSVMLQATAVEAVVLQGSGAGATRPSYGHCSIVHARARAPRCTSQRPAFLYLFPSRLHPFPRIVQRCCPQPELGRCGAGEGREPTHGHRFLYVFSWWEGKPGVDFSDHKRVPPGGKWHTTHGARLFLTNLRNGIRWTRALSMASSQRYGSHGA